MGTRNSTLVQIDGEYKIAQYCQWDGYPEGKGLGILEFLRNSDLQKFKEKASSLKSLTKEEVEKLWNECGSDNSGFVSFDIANRFKEKYPHLHRDTGGRDILELVDGDKIDAVFLNTEFPKNSLWCEWCYVLDMDKKIFEIHKGFNKTPLSVSDRFYKPDLSIETEYYPVKLLASFDMNNLPNDVEFIRVVEERIENLNSGNSHF